MVLLFLIVLGTANVNAQVRIGGNTAPNGAAVLDLNATDATNNGTKGLALPRVNLTSNTMQITSGVANLTGMLVYNTTTTLGVGVYTWTSGTWTKVGGITTVPADSGLFLRSTGSTATWTSLQLTQLVRDTLALKLTPRTATWSLILDTMILMSIPDRTMYTIIISGLTTSDLCTAVRWNSPITTYVTPNVLWVSDPKMGPLPNNSQTYIKCYRAS